MTVDEIKRRLLASGAKADGIPQIMEDVNSVIVRRLAERGAKNLPEEVRNNPPQHMEEWQKILSSLEAPPLTQKDFEEIVESTWEEYFKEIAG